MNTCPNCGMYLTMPPLPKNVTDLINKTMRELPVGKAVADGVITTSLTELYTAVQKGLILVAHEARLGSHS